MKVPMSWLNDYIENLGKIDPKTYAEDITMSGSKVEAIENLGDGIENIVTAKILSIKKHENADSLQICQMDIGKENPIQIVTGATNIKVGDIVPAALDGAKLPDGKIIKKGKLRGELSEGMMCSHEELAITAEELGYQPEYGILILPDTTPIGEDIKTIMGLDETVIEFEITSNRADCFSVIGLARETAITYRKPFNIPVPKFDENSQNIKQYITVDVLNQEKCPRYMARVVKNIKIGPSPAWMVKRLKAAGIRSINNVVDITNYVLLEYGQPLHAFDINDISGGRITVRNAVENEQVTTLDNIKRTLDPSMLVIADTDKVIAIAGVMGAENSEVKDSTTTVVFESANFEGVNVRLTAKKLALRTEASSKYEKGLDKNNAKPALERACELCQMLAGGEVVGGAIDVDTISKELVKIPFCPEKVKTFIGADIDDNFMYDTLKQLGCTLLENNTIVVAPSFRADIETFADVAEEITRMYGYDKIPSTLMVSETIAGGKNYKQQLWDKVKQLCIGSGFYEIITYSFTNPSMFEKLCLPEDSTLRNAVTIMNPLGEENSIMRTTTVHSMMEVLARNFSKRNEHVKLFEEAKIYEKTDEDNLPIEKEIISIGAYGKSVDFFSLKGDIENLLSSIGVNGYSFTPINADNYSYMHPGRTAVIKKGNIILGYMGQIHPDVNENYSINALCYVGELYFSEIARICEKQATYTPMPKYPSVTRDIAIIVDNSIFSADIERIILKSGGKNIVNVSLFDVYEGEKIQDGKKSMAYSAIFRADDRTLTDDEISKTFERILKALNQEIGAQLR